MSTEYLTITALTKYLKRKFDADPYLERVYLTGEISNFRLRPNAHQYFSLKDEQAKIQAIMFKGAFQKLKFQPKEGMKVLVIGRISLYEASGNYQIYVEHMEPDGIGALYQALAERKEKLASEGLFAGPKKALPKYPKKIAVITSPSGAVIRDIITTVNRRYPIVQLVVYPTVVQGDKSAADICRNLARVEEAGDFDVCIVARGGGSIEDLWSFNEETVARAIYASPVPIISSVGHETDVTIADLVADVRAATPTAAAELAVPVLQDEIRKLREQELYLYQLFSQLLKQKKQQLASANQSIIFKQPQRLYEGFAVKLDMISQRLQQSAKQIVQEKSLAYQHVAHQLTLNSPMEQVRRNQQQMTYMQQRLPQVMQQLFRQKEQAFSQAVQSLDILSPLKTLGRGYAYVTKEEKIVQTVTQVTVDEQLTIRLNDGEIEAQVTEIKEHKNE